MSKPPSANPPKRKLTKKQQEEEDERLAKEAAEAAAAALAALPVSPFERIEEVWALDGQFKAQRELVGQIFHVEDGPGVCLQSLSLDDLYAHLVFARRIGLNNEQTREFYAIMCSLHVGLADRNISMEDAFANFKKQVMANAAVTRKQTQQPPAAAAAQPATPGGAVPSLSISSPAGARSGGSTTLQRPLSRNGNKGSTNSPAISARTAAKNPTTPRSGAQQFSSSSVAADGTSDGDAGLQSSPSSSSSSSPSKAFSLDVIRQLTEYVTSGLLQHYRLYRAVFGGPHVFRPRTQTVVERLLLETPVPDAYPSLEYAVELGAVRQAQQAAQQLEEAKRKESAAASDEKSTLHIPSHGLSSAGSDEKDPWGRVSPALGSASTSRPLSAAPSDAPSALEDGDEIGLLVHQHMSRTRTQMMQLLQDNANTLDARIKQVESKLGVGPGATTPAPAAGKAGAAPAKRR